MNVEFVFKIAAIGIIVAILSLVLSRSGREEQALMTTLAGLIVVLLMLVQKISDLFNTIETLFFSFFFLAINWVKRIGPIAFVQRISSKSFSRGFGHQLFRYE